MKLPLLIERVVADSEARRIEEASTFHLRLEKVSCVTGCSSCCYRPISVTILEGLAMYRHLVSNGKWSSSLRERLLKTGREQLGTSPEMWLLSMTPCPLLSEGTLCEAYETRPFTCRIHVSTGDPYYCHPHHLGENTAIVPKEDHIGRYLSHQSKLLRSLGLHSVTMPLGVALPLAERICNGSLQVVNVDHELVQEYAKHG